MRHALLIGERSEPSGPPASLSGGRRAFGLPVPRMGRKHLAAQRALARLDFAEGEGFASRTPGRSAQQGGWPLSFRSSPKGRSAQKGSQHKGCRGPKRRKAGGRNRSASPKARPMALCFAFGEVKRRGPLVGLAAEGEPASPPPRRSSLRRLPLLRPIGGPEGRRSITISGKQKATRQQKGGTSWLATRTQGAPSAGGTCKDREKAKLNGLQFGR